MKQIFIPLWTRNSERQRERYYFSRLMQLETREVGKL